jgi:hypothetical protein
MAITWGSAATFENVGFKLGYEVSKSGATTTIKIYINTKYAVSDKVNTLKVVINDKTVYEDDVSVYTYNNSGSGWADANTKLLKTFYSTAAGEITFSASLTNLELVPLNQASKGNKLTATVSGKTTTYTNGTKGSITAVTDSGKNTFTISGKLGKGGTHNAIKSAVVTYQTLPSGGSWSSEVKLTVPAASIKEGTFSFTLNVPYAKAATTYSVKAKISCTYAINTATTSWATFKDSIKFRYGPNSTIPVISYSKNRLTLKENISFTWNDGTATTDTLPIDRLMGYRLRLYGCNDSDIAQAAADGKSIATLGYTDRKHLAAAYVTSSGDAYYDTFIEGVALENGATYTYDKEQGKHTFTFDPSKFNFSVGDSVFFSTIGRYKYTRADGKTSTESWANRELGYATCSDLTKFQNAGIVHIKVGSQWQEGQVWIKTNSGWKEAETVNVKTASGWKESQ